MKGDVIVTILDTEVYKVNSDPGMDSDVGSDNIR
jgi:hypothetical protein